MSQGSNPYASPDGGEPKRGMSTGVKVLLILGGVFGVLAVLCCGAGIYLFNKFSKAMTTDPAQVAAIQQDIAGINLPEGFKPQGGFDWTLGIKIKAAIYSRSGSEMLMLMQMPSTASEEEMRQQMQDSLAKQGKKQELRVESRETRTVIIDGKEVPFEFTKGTQEGSGRAMRQVIGVFPGRDGTAMLMYTAPEDQWKDEEVMAMLRSISK